MNKVTGDQFCMWSLFTKVRLSHNLWFIISLSFTHLSMQAISILFLSCIIKMFIRLFACLLSITNKSSTNQFTTRSQGMRMTSLSMS